MRFISWAHVAQALQPVQAARAFTLVEMLAVALVIGLLAAVVIPLASNTEGLELDRAAYRIMADIRYVQSQALHKRAPQALVFDPENGFYYRPSDTDTAVPATERISRKPYLIVLRDKDGQKDEDVWAQPHAEEFSTVDLVEADFGGETVLYFDELGLPASSDGTALSAASVGLSAGRTSRTVVLDIATGRVSIN